MKPIVTTLLVMACLCGASVADDSHIHLDRATGRIYSVNFAEKSIEFITTTAYAPKTNEGRTRHTIHWDDDTTFLSVTRMTNFNALKGSYSASLYYLDKANLASLKQGRAFQCRTIDLNDSTRNVTGLRKDEKVLSAMFTPTGALQANVVWDGKTIPFRGRQRRFTVNQIEIATAERLRNGMFEARVFGKVKDGRFVLSRVRLTQISDPRETDNPNLPRLLVIGDSISSNYDTAARAALKGIVNYHRIPNNGGWSGRGVESADLWLGQYQQKGLHWDIVQFNHGLHDLRQTRNDDGSWGAHSCETVEYKKNLETIIGMLRRTGATLLWCNTTPVPNDSSTRRKDEDLVYNRAASEVMSQHPEILLTDLNRAVRDSAAFDQWRTGNNVHFETKAELKVLADTIAASVKRAVEVRQRKQHGTSD